MSDIRITTVIAAGRTFRVTEISAPAFTPLTLAVLGDLLRAARSTTSCLAVCYVRP